MNILNYSLSRSLPLSLPLSLSTLPDDSDDSMQEEEESGPLSPPQLAQLHALPLDELLPLCELNIYCIVCFVMFSVLVL